MTRPQDRQRLNPLLGGPVLALDGEIGAISYFYFDDETWTVRYLVVDTAIGSQRAPKAYTASR